MFWGCVVEYVAVGVGVGVDDGSKERVGVFIFCFYRVGVVYESDIARIISAAGYGQRRFG
ncbi:MAG: hypothetical protein D6735_13615 [Acidobacteria bacterium]|nr:MAG: hypothetical protein D6735_13615 [Acidobacteriota bacterium]